MKNIIQNIFLLLGLSLMVIIVSCDKIEGPYTENEEVIPLQCPVPEFPALGIVYRKVLVEDFTGHKCGYCPRAHVKLHDLISTYGDDTIVSYAMHVSDFYASPDVNGLFTYDFRTDEGTFVDQAFHISDLGLPQGMINRINYNGSVVVPWNSWETVVQSVINTSPKIGMQIINNYNSTDSSFCTHVKLTFLENITEPLLFYCCITEDSIIKPQKSYDVTPNEIPSYNHMHVYRDGLNGNLGVTIDPTKTDKDSSIVKSYFYNLKQKDFKHKNLKIVAFVYKSSNNEVLQAEDEKVK